MTGTLKLPGACLNLSGGSPLLIPERRFKPGREANFKMHVPSAKRRRCLSRSAVVQRRDGELGNKVVGGRLA